LISTNHLAKTRAEIQRGKEKEKSCYCYEGCLKISQAGGSAPLLCRGRQWLLRQIGVVGV